MPNGRRGVGTVSCVGDRLQVVPLPGAGGNAAGLKSAVNAPASGPRRFRSLPWARLAGGRAVPVATSARARLLGLALLDAADAGDGLLIPRCRAVHTVGMRFALDLHFLDARGLPVAVRRAVRPGRFAYESRARSVLELPAVMS